MHTQTRMQSLLLGQPSGHDTSVKVQFTLCAANPSTADCTDARRQAVCFRSKPSTTGYILYHGPQSTRRPYGFH